MWKAILKRELLEYVKSARFLIGLCVVLAVVGLSTLIDAAEYATRHQDYLDAFHTKLPLTGFGIRVAYREPEVLGILVQGKDREVGDLVTGWGGEIFRKPIGFMGWWSQTQRYMSGFAAIDFAFVVRVVMSLLVIFLAYDCVSQERVQGTLRLMMANSLSRGQLLWGKFAGGMAAILGMLTVAVLVAALLMTFYPGVRADGALLVPMAVLWVLSALYLSVFFGLSVLLSTWLSSPVTSLIGLLQIWVVVVVLWPHAGIVLAREMMDVPDARKLEQRKEELAAQFTREYEQANVVPSDPNEKRAYEVRLENGRERLCRQVDLDYMSQLTRQVQIARRLALLSPAALYDRIAQRVSRTDAEEFDRFVQGAERYWREYYWREDGHRDEEDPPPFTQQKQPFVTAVADTVPSWGILFLLGAICFATAHAIFMKKDIG